MAIQLWRARPSGNLKAAVNAAIGNDQTIPTPALCAAIGEGERIAPDGALSDARRVFQAVISSSFAAEPRTASLAAFRLALVQIEESASAGGGGRGPDRAPDAERSSIRAIANAQDCVGLDDDNAAGQVSDALRCAIERAATADDPELAALSSLRLVHYRISESANLPSIRRRALEEADRGLTFARQAVERSATDRRRSILFGLIEAHLEASNNLGGAAPSFDALVGLARLAGAGASDIVLARSEAIEARIALRRGDTAGARRLATSAVARAAIQTAPVNLPEYLLLLAESDAAGSPRHVAAAYDALSAVRPLLPLRDPLTEEPNYARKLRPIYERAALSELEKPSPDFGAVRDIIESARQAELESVLGSECAPLRDALKPTQLTKREVLIYPLLSENRLDILYATASTNGFQRITVLGQTRRSMAQRAVGLRSAITNPTAAIDEWRTPARELYEILIKPVERETGALGEDSTVIVVPDGVLSGAPFAALLDENGKPLGVKSRVVIAPALSVSEPGVADENRRARILAGYLAKEAVIGDQMFGALEFTATETQAIKQASPATRVMANFTRKDLEDSLTRNKVDVLHLATHAAFNGRSERTFIVTADKVPLPLADLKEMVSGSRARGETLDLIVLSACETALGDDQASMGLAGAAVQAGARSALASLWTVNDKSTEQFMAAFYASYARGEAKAEAVRKAQAALWSGGDASPKDWSAFSLVGAWR
ncbi:MAG: CHAT domain-containing protein [Caulobacterales bacterium]